jgi:hypothetical protein
LNASPSLSISGVSKAVKNVNEVLGPALIKSGLDVTQQKEIDELLCKEDGVRLLLPSIITHDLLADTSPSCFSRLPTRVSSEPTPSLVSLWPSPRLVPLPRFVAFFPPIQAFDRLIRSTYAHPYSHPT